MTNLDGISGLSRNTPSTVTLTVYFLGPIAGKTPLWIRLARLRYSHIAFAIGGKLWDQPFNDYCHVYDEAEWLVEKRKTGNRSYAAFTVRGELDWSVAEDAVNGLAGVRSIPPLIALRWLHLWPRPVRNCVTPVRTLLNIMGHFTDEETCDGIYKSLRFAAKACCVGLYGLDPRVVHVAAGSLGPYTGTN